MEHGTIFVIVWKYSVFINFILIVLIKFTKPAAKFYEKWYT